jgi:hypothetical protein
MRRHQLPYKHHKEMLRWLEDNVQPNRNKNGDKHASSSVSQFIEWRSLDLKSWIFRVAGNPPKCYVEIADEQKELLFLLRWS